MTADCQHNTLAAPEVSLHGIVQTERGRNVGVQKHFTSSRVAVYLEEGATIRFRPPLGRGLPGGNSVCIQWGLASEKNSASCKMNNSNVLLAHYCY